ncbi:hypothetical protein WJX75_005755 [Coccomyxa subellipsoidea]|uniref:Uncharacterized protein n=1 Tax=Coccomyxa subellipsoidea TaxID=248742 RepID=A0ABR2YFJ5_9CHLO
MTGGSISYLLGRASIRDYYQSHSTPDSKTYRFTEGRAPLQLLEQVVKAQGPGDTQRDGTFSICRRALGGSLSRRIRRSHASAGRCTRSCDGS